MVLSALDSISPQDRFGVSLVGSALLHIVVILGVAFVWPKLRVPEGLPTLEITLVQTASDKAPKEAEFLANASQDGGGQTDSPDIARSPFPIREITDQRRMSPPVLTAPQPRVNSPRETTDFLTQTDPRRTRTAPTQPEKKDRRAEPPNPGVIERAAVDAERARLNAEISRSLSELQKRPRRKFLNARTQEYKFAAYMDAWRAKVERIGNLNYPEEAKRRHLTGSLVLDVVLRYDGSIAAITVRRSSGHKLLDDAAVRIVELASPYAPFPNDIRAEVDELMITRTWKFNELLTAE
jgi:protein TonB